MSVWIRSRQRTAIHPHIVDQPLKYSPSDWLPPIHNGLATPESPPTAPHSPLHPVHNNRNCDPSYVNATCDHDTHRYKFAVGSTHIAEYTPAEGAATGRPQRPRLSLLAFMRKYCIRLPLHDRPPPRLRHRRI